MDSPLSDLLVLDLTRALAGPIAGRLLSDLGADVIKVEPPDGDLTRSTKPRQDSMAVYFVQANAGKRCVSIDLTTDDGRDLFLTMVEKADIVLENYRPGVMDRLGLSYDVLAGVNPRVILASVSGYGHGNVWSHRGAFAAAVQAETGLTADIAKRRHTTPRGTTRPPKPTSTAACTPWRRCWPRCTCATVPAGVRRSTSTWPRRPCWPTT